MDIIETDDGFAFDVGEGEDSCLFSDEEHAQIYELLLEIKDMMRDVIRQQKIFK